MAERDAFLRWIHLQPSTRKSTVGYQPSYRSYRRAEAPWTAVDTEDLLHALQNVEKRAERVNDDEHVISTYVDSGALISALFTTDNGIVYGRRGTGKTHALKYLAEVERKKGNFVIYIDVEKDLGSTEGLYADNTLAVTERATRLLVDVIGKVHDALIEEAFNGRGSIDTLDSIFDHFGEIVVADAIEQENMSGVESAVGGNAGLSVDVGAKGPSAGVKFSTSEHSKSNSERRTKISGSVHNRVHFGAVANLLGTAINEHPARRFWLLFDEWSSLPRDLQPYLAEMLRRIFFSNSKVTARIAAIPHRTEWRISRPNNNGYIGLEVGAEIFPMLDLDEFVVFPARSREEQARRSTDFFSKLLTRHLNRQLAEAGKSSLRSNDEVVTLLFTQKTALLELIRAAEGVPRDALLIVSRAALRAGERRISTDHIRDAARQVYQSTKEALLNGVPGARELLDRILAEVISNKRARAFLLAQEHATNPLILKLVDDRILHIIKRGYSSKAEPGVRFDVLEIDYGCYVQLLRTSSAPQGLINGISDDDLMESFYADMEVPEDDYRAIRRAVLELPQLVVQA